MKHNSKLYAPRLLINDRKKRLVRLIVLSEEYLHVNKYV